MEVNIVQEIFTWLMLFVVLLNISQRKYKRSDSKRAATLYIAIDCLAVYTFIALFAVWELPGWMVSIPIALGIAIAIILRKKMWPFRLHCAKCGKKLEYNRIIAYDENLCQDCYWEAHPEEKAAEEEKNKTREELLEEKFAAATSVDDIPWDDWEPTETCVLTYVIDGNRVLMIEKKTGLGSGYINAPGGHIELEETKTEAAIRETKEETGLDVADLEERGTLRFQFKDGLRMLGYVFFTSTFSGELIDECEETKPFWTDIDSLDYSAMWEDDRLWLPLALEGKKFSGLFIFDGNTMIDSRVTEDDEDL